MKKNMKILHIAPIGHHAEGIGTVVERLSREQTALGHDVKIVTTSQNLTYHNLSLIYVKTKTDLRRVLENWRPDVVLFHSIWVMHYIGLATVLRLEGIPYAVMMHGANSIENIKKSYWKKKLANELWFNKFLVNAEAIIYLSRAEYECCVSKDLNQHNVIIPNGCDQVNDYASKNTMHDPINIIYLGRLAIHHKGIDYLLGALKILQSRDLNSIHVCFYGNENDTDTELIKRRLAELEEIASYEGPAYDEKKKSVLSNADAFILTSRYEGMPMGVLEALSYGVPCILTPGTNMAEDVVKEGAGWETDFEVQSIANTIMRAVADLRQNYHEYHEAAYNMSKRYDWKTIAKQHIAVMDRISKRS